MGDPATRRLGAAVLLLAIAVAVAAILARGGADVIAVGEGSGEAARSAAVRTSGSKPVAEARAARPVERTVEESRGDATVASGESEAGRRLEVVVTVRNEAGVAVEGIDVVAEPADPNEPRTVSRRDRKGTTDRQGVCRLRLFDGPFRIGANRRGTDEGLTAESVIATVAPDAIEWTIVLRRKAASLHVVCVDDRDLPMAEVELHVLPDDLRADTGPDGRASFEALPVGRHRLFVVGRKDGYVVESEHDRTFDLVAGQRELVRFRYARRGRLEVRVEPAPPEPIRVRVRARERVWTGRGGYRPISASGVATFDVAPGTYDVEALFPSTSPLSPLRPVEAVVRAGERTSVVVPVRAYDGVLAGRVVDTRGRPVAEADVEVRSAGSGAPKRASTAEDGTFEIRGLPDLALELRAEHRAVSTGSDEPLLRLDGPALDVELRIPSLYRIEGTVRRPPRDTAPLDDRVYFWNEAVYGRWWDDAKLVLDASDPTRGTFSHPNLLAGTYLVRYGVIDDPSATTTVTIAEDGPDVTRVALTAPSSMETGGG